MMRRLVLLALIAAAALRSGEVRAQLPEPTAAQPTLPQAAIVILARDGRRLGFDVELAATAREQTTGLMFRPSLAPGKGMLFLWARPWRAEMWMKNTLVPLDMLFIRSDGVIDTIHANAVPESEVTIASRDPVAATLELPGGTVGRLGIAEGDRVLDLPPPPAASVGGPVVWPDFQERLEPGPAASSIKAALPDGFQAASAGPEVPAALRGFAGRWRGWLGRERAGSVAVGVAALAGDGAEIVYAYANAARPASPAPRRLPMQAMPNGDLQGVLPGDGVLSLRLRRDGNMDIMLSEGFLWVTGVLSPD
jgi:uncharacterized membrane protein (UPF0127 family)